VFRLHGLCNSDHDECGSGEPAVLLELRPLHYLTVNPGWRHLACFFGSVLTRATPATAEQLGPFVESRQLLADELSTRLPKLEFGNSPMRVAAGTLKGDEGLLRARKYGAEDRVWYGGCWFEDGP
jgi:hypothetical protein